MSETRAPQSGTAEAGAGAEAGATGAATAGASGTRRKGRGRGKTLRGGARAGGRSGNRERRADAIKQLPRRRFRNRLRHMELLSDDEIESIHQASLKVLREVGMSFMHEEALAVLRDHGAEIVPGTDVVKFAPEFLMEHLAKAPSRYELRGRNESVRHILGEDEVVFGTVSSAPNCSDLDKGRRPGNFEDFKNLIRLNQYFNAVTIVGGYPVEPADLPPDTRHLDAIQFILENTDRPLNAYALGRARILDGLEMVRRACAMDDEALQEAVYLMTVVNTSSPLRLDGPMIEGLIEMARHKQLVIITPFTLSGAMAPATTAGALVMQNAEALASIAFAQMVNPGAPCAYGTFTSNVDMRSGAPAFGTPEYVKATLASGQLARRYGLPMRSSNTCAANAVDGQSAYESMFSLWAVMLSGAHICKHGAGWMEGGLVASFEKLVMDVDLIQQFSEIMRPFALDEDGLALEAIAEIGQGGHFFGSPHTIARYETAFYEPIVSDWRNFGAWEEAGSPQTAEHCNRIWKAALAEFEPPAMDEGRRESLEAYRRLRHEQGGIATMPEVA